MDGLREFFDMGGYAGFVWPSYLAVAMLLIALTVLSIRALKAAEADLEALEETTRTPDTTSNGGAAQP